MRDSAISQEEHRNEKSRGDRKEKRKPGTMGSLESEGETNSHWGVAEAWKRREESQGTDVQRSHGRRRPKQQLLPWRDTDLGVRYLESGSQLCHCLMT